MNIYDITVKDRKGQDVSLANFKGKVLLIVNTATGCGFTPQYEGLENLYKKYHEKGLEILDFPCNQFGNQAPGSDDEIHEFCTLKYKTTFDQFAKVDVNGENQSPLFKYLKEQKGFEGFEGLKGKILIPVVKAMDPDYKNNSDIISSIEIEKKDLQQVHKKKLFSFAFKEDTNLNVSKKFECKYILDFCDSFPNLKSDDSSNYFNYEEEIKLKQFLDEYFKITNEYIMKEEMFSEYEPEEKKNIQHQIENYIHAHIYHKIFYENPSENDNKIFEICEKYNSIKPSDINDKIKYDDEKMVQIMIHFVQNMENEMSPKNKIHEFEIIDMIINDIINIYGYDDTYYNYLLLYAFIKAKPKMMDSTLKYINIYLDNDSKNIYDNLIKKMLKLVQNLKEFKLEENK